MYTVVEHKGSNVRRGRSLGGKSDMLTPSKYTSHKTGFEVDQTVHTTRG